MCAEGSLSSSHPLRLTTKARRDRPSIGDRSLGWGGRDGERGGGEGVRENENELKK